MLGIDYIAEHVGMDVEKFYRFFIKNYKKWEMSFLKTYLRNITKAWKKDELIDYVEKNDPTGEIIEWIGKNS